MDSSKTPKKDLRQCPQKVALWRDTTLKLLKEKAAKEDYEIFFHDESTLQLCANVVTTYSPRGQTPIIGSVDTKGYQYVCLASSISQAGQLFFQINDTAFKGVDIVAYLLALLKTTTNKIMLIWDNASCHKAKEVQEFLNTTEGKRVWLARLPPYSPELNPDELVWARLKKVEMANSVAKNLQELKNKAEKALQKIQQATEFIKNCFNDKNFNFTN